MNDQDVLLIEDQENWVPPTPQDVKSLFVCNTWQEQMTRYRDVFTNYVWQCRHHAWLAAASMEKQTCCLLSLVSQDCWHQAVQKLPGPISALRDLPESHQTIPTLKQKYRNWANFWHVGGEPLCSLWSHFCILQHQNHQPMTLSDPTEQMCSPETTLFQNTTLLQQPCKKHCIAIKASLSMC